MGVFLLFSWTAIYNHGQKDAKEADGQTAKHFDVSVGERLEASGSKPQAEQSKRDHNSDLEAQWTMAVAAVLGVGTSVLGLGLLWRNLQQVNEANRQATRAADAADKSFEEGRLVAQRQTRAYITVTTATAFRGEREDGSSQVFVRVEFINSGQSPAVQVRGRARLILGSEAEFYRADLKDIDFESESVMGPQSQINSSGHLDGVSLAQLVAAERNGHRLWIKGEQLYDDIFGGKWSLQYGFCLKNFGGMTKPMNLLQMTWVNGENSLQRTDGQAL